MKQQLTIGIDIGTSMTRVVACTLDGGNTLPKIAASSSVDTRGMRHGYITSREEVALSLRKAVQEVEKEIGAKIKNAAIAIGGVGITSEYAVGMSVATRADGIISKFDIDKAIQDAESRIDLKNKAILHAYPILFKVDGQELPTRPEGINGVKLEVRVLFVTCFQQHLDDLLAVTHDLGIRITGFTATPLATEKLLLTDLQRNFGCTLIDIGAETVSVSVFENNTLTSLFVFAIGSLDITKDIALGLRVTPEEAESIKMGTVSFQSGSKKKLDEIIEARLSDIFELVDKYFKKIGRSGLLPAGAIIIGGGSRMQLVETVAKSMLRIPVKVAHVDFPGTKGPIKDNRLLVAYSIAVANEEPQQGGSVSASKPRRVSLPRVSSGSDGESVWDAIKSFFKQLMP
ncbi:MAG TPA: cell division FtsA domain-containing protein [Candidatus Paceibacterota bacterium]|jgi:cell division protein FtsA|nr:cell division FtsA domain-containing protein [Candidatus Paceibacterota bacterium]